MRLFVAVFPPPEAVEHLAAAVARLHLTRRVIPPDRWHITLAFLGDVPLATAEPAPGGGSHPPQAGPSPEPQAGRSDQLEAGHPHEPQTGPSRRPEAGHSDQPEAGRSHEPQAGPSPELEAGRSDQPEAGHPPEPQAGPLPEPQAGRSHEPQAGRSHEPQAGRSHEPQVGAEDLGRSHDAGGGRSQIAEEAVWGALDRITVAVGEVSVASGGRFGQTVWAGVRGDTRGLTRLSRAVRRELRAVRVRSDDKRFRPHLTIARSAEGLSSDDMAKLKAYQGPSWPVSELVLVRSELGPHPEYRRLGAWPVTINAPG